MTRLKTTFLALSAVILAVSSPALSQETSADFSGGSVIIGGDTRTCSGTIEGNIRYTGGPWSPANLATPPILWFDATDDSTIVHTAGAVSTWTDKINGRVASLETGSPTYSTTQFESSLPGINFDGNDRMDGTLASAVTGDASIFFVMDHSNITASFSQAVSLNAGGIAWDNQQSFWVGSQNSGTHNGRTHSQGGSQVDSGNWSTTGDLYYGGARNTANQLFGAMNGQISLDTQAKTMNMNSTTDDFYIGGDVGANNYNLNGVIGEIIALDYEPSLADRQTIEGYLAHKWGIASKLPGAHPYSASPPDDLTAGLVGHWRLDESSGTSVADSSGQGNNGTASDATPTWSSGQDGGALDIDSDEAVDVPSFDVSGTGLTLAGWVYLESSTADPRVICKADGISASDSNWCFLVDNADLLTLRLTTTGGFEENFTDVNYFANYPNTWKHVAITYDSGTGGIVYYLDGVQVDTDTHSLGGDVAAQSKTIGLGNNPSSLGTRQWDGLLDDLRVYDRPLSAAEVAKLHTPDTGNLQFCNGTAWTDF